MNPPEPKTVELFSKPVALVRMPPALVSIDWVPPGAPGGTAADNARVPSRKPLLPAGLTSVIAVPVPFQEAGKSYSKRRVLACASDAARPNTAATADMGVNVFMICFFIAIAFSQLFLFQLVLCIPLPAESEAIRKGG